MSHTGLGQSRLEQAMRKLHDLNPRLQIDAIAENLDDLQKVAMTEGMRDLRADGLTKAAEGQTSVQEVLRVAV